MKVYHTFDFESAKKRVEPNIVDKYAVQAEDYENLNDLIKRSIRTKTRFHEEKVYDSEYDIKLDDDEILSDEVVEDLEAKQSEAEEPSTTEEENKSS